jgi:hypothetical protein
LRPNPPLGHAPIALLVRRGLLHSQRHRQPVRSIIPVCRNLLKSFLVVSINRSVLFFQHELPFWVDFPIPNRFKWLQVRNIAALGRGETDAPIFSGFRT